MLAFSSCLAGGALKQASQPWFALHPGDLQCCAWQASAEPGQLLGLQWQWCRGYLCISTADQALPSAVGCLPTLATIPIFWGLYRTLSDVANAGLLTEGFYWIPSLSGPTSLAAQRAGQCLFLCPIPLPKTKNIGAAWSCVFPQSAMPTFLQCCAPIIREEGCKTMECMMPGHACMSVQIMLQALIV